MLLFYVQVNAQKSINDILKKHNTKNISYISVQELAMPKTKAIVLDAREYREFEVSHLKDAIYVGYKEFNLDSIKDSFRANSSDKIVVYCSIGIRSETIANKLKKVGFTNVYNLYGGIFEWKNKGLHVYNMYGVKTEKVHVKNPFWGKWLIKGVKVYE